VHGLMLTPGGPLKRLLTAPSSRTLVAAEQFCRSCLYWTTRKAISSKSSSPFDGIDEGCGCRACEEAVQILLFLQVDHGADRVCQ
jgi:hypothetical protein